MLRTALRPRRASALALAGLTTLLAFALPGSAPTQAAPPTESDFVVIYHVTDENGDVVRQMSQNDMELFINQARCECNQQIVTRITYQGSGADPLQLSGFIGQFCDQAQATVGIGAYKLCAEFVTGLPQTFQTGPEYAIDPIWLAYGVQGSDQNISTATPAGTCTGGQTGEGGVWMCAGVTECQMGNFFMTGTSNLNIPQGQTASGILFDYLAPVSPPTNFSVSAGDSAVEISWENAAPGDIAGYRVLCADQNGNPVETDFSFTPPTATSIVNGTIYFTTSNLCPDGPFAPRPGDGQTGDGDGDPGDGDGDPGDGDGDPICEEGMAGCACALSDPPCADGLACVDGVCCTPGENDCECDAQGECDNLGAACNEGLNRCECPEGGQGCACIGGTDCDGELACNDATGTCESPIGCNSGELGCTCIDGVTCNTGLDCVGGFCQQPSSGIYSLDWSYVCSDHLGFNTTRARIDGLENGQDYTFLVVAYDRAGNPVYGDTIVARPIPTNGLWEQCEAQGNICGEGWTCSIADEPGGLGWLLGGLGLAGLGVGVWARRRRRRG